MKTVEKHTGFFFLSWTIVELDNLFQTLQTPELHFCIISSTEYLYAKLWDWRWLFHLLTIGYNLSFQVRINAPILIEIDDYFPLKIIHGYQIQTRTIKLLKDQYSPIPQGITNFFKISASLNPSWDKFLITYALL